MFRYLKEVTFFSGVALFIYKDSKATASTAGGGIGLGEVLLVSMTLQFFTLLGIIK